MPGFCILNRLNLIVIVYCICKSSFIRSASKLTNGFATVFGLSPGGSKSLALDRRALCEVVLRGTWTMWLKWSWRKFFKSFRSYHLSGVAVEQKDIACETGMFLDIFPCWRNMKQNQPTYSIKNQGKIGRKSIPLSIPNHKRLRCLKLILGLVVVASWQIPRQIQQLPACGFASACFYRADAIAPGALSWEGTLEPHSGLARPDEFTGWDMYELVHCFGYEQQKITWSFQGPGSCLRECLMASL